MKSNYVSISAISSQDDLLKVCGDFEAADFTLNANHAPAVGFTVTDKTVVGSETNSRCAKTDEITDMAAASHGRVLNIIHYRTFNVADEYHIQTSNAVGQLLRTKLFHILHLSNDTSNWMPIASVDKLKKNFPDTEFVLQLSDLLMKGRTPQEIAAAVTGYGDAISAIQIDPSRGRGVRMNVADSLNVYTEIRNKTSDISVVFAGGLNGENVAKTIAGLKKGVGNCDFSIDAEAGLRDNLGHPTESHLNLTRVSQYIRGSAQALRGSGDFSGDKIV